MLIDQGKTMISLNEFKSLVPSGNLFLCDKASTTNYSDGNQAQQYILHVIKESPDITLNSESLAAAIKDWPSEYHLSPTRANLLKPFTLGENKRILELGSGCGALTRILGELGHSVHAVEGARDRALITAERCRDLDKVKVFNANFNEIEFENKFYDFILLIGVLEYSALFLNDKSLSPGQALSQILGTLKTKLKKDGALIIAIENKLGFKYLSGCTEDHTGIEYESILDYPNTEGTKTFTKNQLEETLKSTGFDYIQFFYPFPDYKIPQTIISDQFFQTIEHPESLFASMIFRDYSSPRGFRIPEPMFCQTLQEDYRCKAWSKRAHSKRK